MEAEMSQGLPLVTWRPRRANGKCSSLNQNAEGHCASSKRQTKKNSLPPPFCSIQLIGQPTLAGPPAQLSPLIQMLFSLSTLTGTPRIMFDQTSGLPLPSWVWVHRFNSHRGHMLTSWGLVCSWPSAHSIQFCLHVSSGVLRFSGSWTAPRPWLFHCSPSPQKMCPWMQ